MHTHWIRFFFKDSYKTRHTYVEEKIPSSAIMTHIFTRFFGCLRAVLYVYFKALCIPILIVCFKKSMIINLSIWNGILRGCVALDWIATIYWTDRQSTYLFTLFHCLGFMFPVACIEANTWIQIEINLLVGIISANRADFLEL